MASWEFPCDGPIDLSANIAAGTVTVSAEPVRVATAVISRSGRDTETDLETEISVDYDAAHLRVTQLKPLGLRLRGHSFDVRITVPIGSNCVVATAAADVTCHGELGSLDVKTASGTVTSDLVRGRADIVTTSGAIRLGEVSGRVSAKTASGMIRLATLADDVDAASVSGDITIGTARACVSAGTASGRIRIENVSRGDTSVKTVSGDVSVAVAPGVGVYLDLSSLTGKVSSDLQPDDEARHDAGLRLHCRSVSGRLRVTRAQTSPAAG